VQVLRIDLVQDRRGGVEQKKSFAGVKRDLSLLKAFFCLIPQEKELEGKDFFPLSNMEKGKKTSWEARIIGSKAEKRARETPTYGQELLTRRKKEKKRSLTSGRGGVSRKDSR